MSDLPMSVSLWKRTRQDPRQPEWDVDLVIVRIGMNSSLGRHPFFEAPSVSAVARHPSAGDFVSARSPSFGGHFVSVLAW